MRMRFLIPLAGALALVVACSLASAAPGPSSPTNPTNPKIRAKQAEENRVLNEIATIDEGLNAVSEQYDGARVRFDALRKKLAAERVQLVGAKLAYHQAQQRASKFLFWLYTQNKSSSIDVILGARSIPELLQLNDAENAISTQETTIASDTIHTKLALEAKVRQLDTDRAAAAATVRELQNERKTILRGLAERRRLLAHVEKQVAKLQAEERARQARLAAEARARVEAEIAAQKKAAEAAARTAARAAARHRAELAAQAKAAAAAAEAVTTTTATTTAETATTTASTTTTAPLAPPTTTTPVVTVSTTPPPTSTNPPVTAGSVPVIPTSQLPPGHPQAAQIALEYLGVPYLWGGSTPKGFDCSGLVTYVYAQLGVILPHFAAAQWTFGDPVAVSQLQAGDLVFFDQLDHVGIYLGDGEFIDAPHTGSFVRIDTLSEPWYAKHYVGARRI
jgi:cell wall-associated NlpC family hydrolase